MSNILVFLYLCVIVVANLFIVWFGPGVSILNAFLFIGLDITTRDTLHERWKDNLWRNMFFLILTGSIISGVLNVSATRIAVASFLAFALAGVVDTLVYGSLYNKSKLVKINVSNIFSATVDSLVFVIVAFGFPVLVPVVIGQIVAKIVGGFLWSTIINKYL